MSNNQNFYDSLRMSGIEVTEEQQEQINRRLGEILTYEPRIGIFGKTGAGKSSLCNALFGQDICRISDVAACTRDTQEVLLDLGGKGVKLLDVPGVGESTERDEEYGKLYASLLPELDLVLWLIKADDRAMASDENFYRNIVKPHIAEGKPFFFVLNQVDKIEPFREWDEERHQPGPRQFQNIHRKVDDVARFFNVAASQVIPVSANEKYNLTKLVDEFIRALPPEKRITAYKAVNEEFRSKSTGEHVRKSFVEVVGEALRGLGDHVDVHAVGADIVDKALDRLSGGWGKPFDPVCRDGRSGGLLDSICDSVGDFFGGIGDFFGW